MKLTSNNLEKIFNYIESQLEDGDGRGEFDKETPILSAVDRTIEMFKENEEKKTTKNKPKYIQATYHQTIEFDLEELGIDWDKVDSYSIKHSELDIYYTDGTTKTFSSTIDYDIDWKWADSEKVLDEGWCEVDVE